MKKPAWLLAGLGILASCHFQGAKPQRGTRLILDGERVDGLVYDPDKGGDSALAVKYGISPRPFAAAEAKALLNAFGMPPGGKADSTGVNFIYRSGKARLIYLPSHSEFAYANDSAAELDERDYLSDSLIRTRTDSVLQAVLKEKAEEYVFTNSEKTLVQRDSAQKGVPAYYYGRYLRKLDGRYVLGNRYQIRIGYGGGGGIKYFSLRNPELSPSREVKTCSRQLVVNTVVEASRSRKGIGPMHYPFAADKPLIESLRPVRVFDAYVEAAEKDGEYLLPVTALVAEAKLEPAPKQSQVPRPDEPVLLHFIFPCVGNVGLCWPGHSPAPDQSASPGGKKPRRP